MSLVDLSEYDQSTKAPEREIEVINHRSGGRGTISIEGEEMDAVLVDFLRGRIDVDSVISRVNPVDEGVPRQNLIRLGSEIVKTKVNNLLVRLVR